MKLSLSLTFKNLLSKKPALAIPFLLLGSIIGAQEVEIIKSAQPSLEKAIKKIYVSAPTENTSAELPNLAFVDSLASVEYEAIKKVIEDKSVPDSEKEVTLVRYTLGDPRITQILVQAKKQGIKVSLITDLNPVMTGDFSDIKGKFTSAFSKAKLKDTEKSPGAKVIQELLDAGFEYKKDILSQPLYSPELERSPIMHEKSLLIKNGNHKTTFFGTANLAPNPRYNRTFEIEDDTFYDRYQSHIESLKDIYRKGKETKEIADEPRTLIQYPDGTEVELAFTNGNYNPNDRLADLLKNNKLEHIDLSHFVITHREFLKALGVAISKNPEATGFAVADDRFSAIKGWGLAPALVGIDVFDPYNRKVTGLSPKAFQQIESYVYQRPAIDPQTGKIRIERSENGPPVARHVWHDKTTVVDYVDDSGKPKTSVFTGSFNLSNNIANSEFQAQMNIPRDSWINKALKHSIRNVVKTEPNYAIPNLEASLRNAMGLLLGITDIEIPLELNRRLFQASDKRDFDTMKKILKELAQIKTELHWKMSEDQRQERVNQYIDFLSWYQEHIPPSQAELEVRNQRLIGIALVIAQPQLEDYQKANILSKVIERPQLTTEQHHQLLNGAFKQLGLGDVNPWSGMESKLFSIEQIVDEKVVKEKEAHPKSSLRDLISQKIDEKDFSWKGPAFDPLMGALESEKRTSLLSIISSGLFSPEEISDFFKLLNERRTDLGITTELKKFLKSHVFDTTDKEKLATRLESLFLSQLKKGITKSQVQSNDPNLISVLSKIKRGQTGDFAEFQIQVPKKESDNCAEVLSSLAAR